MLRILFMQGGRACPVFDCDVCDDMIGVPQEGIAIWRDPHRRDDLTKTRTFHVHAGGDCEKQMRAHFEGSADSQPLGAHVYYLCSNLEIGADELNALKKRYSRA